MSFRTRKPNNNRKPVVPEYRINHEIEEDRVRIVGEGIQSRIVPIDEALKIATSQGLDLVEVNTSTSPHIVRVVNYEKWRYEQKKNTKRPKQQQVKEVQLRTNISENDLKTKANKAKEFIANGDKVKVTLTMKGRELSRRQDSKKCLLQFIILMEDVAVPESAPKDEGNRCMVTLKKKN